jgi:hypothetical protein
MSARCPRAWELQQIDDLNRLKQLLNEAEHRRRRVGLYMVAVRMRMHELSKQQPVPTPVSEVCRG